VGNGIGSLRGVFCGFVATKHVRDMIDKSKSRRLFNKMENCKPLAPWRCSR